MPVYKTIDINILYFFMYQAEITVVDIECCVNPNILKNLSLMSFVLLRHGWIAMMAFKECALQIVTWLVTCTWMIYIHFHVYILVSTHELDV